MIKDSHIRMRTKSDVKSLQEYSLQKISTANIGLRVQWLADWYCQGADDRATAKDIILFAKMDLYLMHKGLSYERTGLICKHWQFDS
jgi:hypothetical protein